MQSSNALENVLDFSFLGFLTLFLVEQRDYSTTDAAAMVALALGGATLGYVVLAAIGRGLTALTAFATTSAARLVGIALLVVVTQPVVIACTVFGFGIAGAVYWVSLQASMLRARPGQTGTTYAVIATLSLPALAVPPVIGAATDRFGVAAGLSLYALVPAAILLMSAAPRVGRLRSLRPWRRLSSSSRR